ncbi:MAG: nucleotidyltransferase family protein [Betaproteobacteria bacterium]
MSIGGGWRPDAGQELLLAAVVGPESRAAAAFAQWRRTHDIDTLDAGSTRLLPLLVPRRDLLDAEDAPWPIIRGCHRRAFVHGQLLARRASEALRLLADAGIRTLALKGAALLAYYDHNPALRPMNDFDVLVPRANADAAIRLLLEHGWRSQWPQPQSLPLAYHGACFTSADDLDLDLHWQVLAAARDSDAPAIWDASVECTIPGGATRAPCAADLLTIVCAHAAPWTPVSPVRWVADALRIVAGQDRFDWPRVVERAKAWRVSLALHDTLSYLAERWQVDVPAEILRALKEAPVDAVDRRAHATLGGMPGLGAYLMRPWRRFRVHSRELPAWRALPGFVRYLEVTLGQPRVDRLPQEIARRIGRFRRDRRSGKR